MDAVETAQAHVDQLAWGTTVPALGGCPAGRPEGGPGDLVRAARLAGADPAPCCSAWCPKSCAEPPGCGSLGWSTVSRPPEHPVEAPAGSLHRPRACCAGFAPLGSRISTGSTARPPGWCACLAGGPPPLLGPKVAPALGAPAVPRSGSTSSDGPVDRRVGPAWLLRQLARNPTWRVDVDGKVGGGPAPGGGAPAGPPVGAGRG